MKSIADMKLLLEELKTQPKKSFGQNFLVNEAVIAKIISYVQLLKPKSLIEIGPGLGALTEHLIKFESPLKLIELDRDLVEHWRKLGLEVIDNDALKVDWQKISNTIPITLVSNLPYQISSSLVVDLSVTDTLVENMVLMFQKEVAQRIQARVRTNDYGLLSVISQSAWDTERVCDANPSSFYPPPKVAGRVLIFRRKPSPGIDGNKFLKMVKAAFAQRRKLLHKNLKSILSDKDESLIGVLKKMGFSEKVRAEELSPDQFIELFRNISGSFK